MTYEYFIASRYRNKKDVLDLAKKIRAKGKTVYCFIEIDTTVKHLNNLDANPEIAMREFEAIVDWRNSEIVKSVFETDMNALKESEKLILLLPAGKSAHMEAGTAYGLGKRLIQIGEQQKTESLYLVFNEVYPDIDSFIATL